MTVEEASGDPVEVWPDNLVAVNVLIAIGTQWRTGMSGPTGLDYNVLYKKMDRMQLSPERYEELEEEIRLLEDAALAVMRKKK